MKIKIIIDEELSHFSQEELSEFDFLITFGYMEIIFEKLKLTMCEGSKFYVIYSITELFYNIKDIIEEKNKSVFWYLQNGGEKFKIKKNKNLIIFKNDKITFSCEILEIQFEIKKCLKTLLEETIKRFPVIESNISFNKSRQILKEIIDFPIF